MYEGMIKNEVNMEYSRLEQQLRAPFDKPATPIELPDGPVKPILPSGPEKPVNPDPQP